MEPPLLKPKPTELDNAIKAFQALSTAPRDSTTQSSSATKQLPSLVKKADALIKDQLDKLMTGYATSEPMFHGEPRPPTLDAHWDHEPSRFPADSKTSTDGLFCFSAVVPESAGQPVHGKYTAARVIVDAGGGAAKAPPAPAPAPAK